MIPKTTKLPTSKNFLWMLLFNEIWRFSDGLIVPDSEKDDFSIKFSFEAGETNSSYSP